MSIEKAEPVIRLDRIKVDGYKGTFYEINRRVINGKQYFLMEHNTVGEECCVIIDADHKLVIEDVCNGFDDLEYAIEEGLI
jgi:hypothetical protein